MRKITNAQEEVIEIPTNKPYNVSENKELMRRVAENHMRILKSTDQLPKLNRGGGMGFLGKTKRLKILIDNREVLGTSFPADFASEDDKGLATMLRVVVNILESSAADDSNLNEI